jgi:RNA ligase (TIGR02306 family)
MSNWKVSKEKISIFTHPTADNLSLGKVGSYQVVVQKGLYKDGDEVIFAPEKSVLTGDIKSEFEKYLAGTNKDRVKSVRLRGEISTGIIIPKHLVTDFETFEVGVDISETLQISKYEPPIPTQLAGKVKPFSMPFVGSHDCEHVGVYVNELVDGERVVISEKVHGSQFILAHNVLDNETIVSSKGLLKSGLTIEKSDENTYWIAANNDKVVEKIRDNFDTGVIQVFGEVIPVQSGYSYGQTKPTVRIFDIRVDGESIPYDMVPDVFKSLWVPIVFDGNLTLDKKEVVIYSDPERGIHKTKLDFLLPKSIVDLCKGKELVSGRECHIREGVVLRPYVDRNAIDGTKLRLKIINPAYKESGEEIS